MQDSGSSTGARVRFDGSRRRDRTVVDANQTRGCMDNELELIRPGGIATPMAGGRCLLQRALHKVSLRRAAHLAVPAHGADGNRRRNR